MTAGWMELGKFWHDSCIPFAARRATFLSKIVESALAGLLSFVFTDVQYGKLDSKLSGFMRSMFRGGAHWLDEKGHHRVLSRLELFKKWKILPPAFLRRCS